MFKDHFPTDTFKKLYLKHVIKILFYKDAKVFIYLKYILYTFFFSNTSHTDFHFKIFSQKTKIVETSVNYNFHISIKLNTTQCFCKKFC